MKSAKLANNIALIPILVFILFVIGILTTSFFNFKYHKDRIINEKKIALYAIASLKAEQVKSWKNERIGNANTLMDNYFLAEKIATFFKSPNTLDKSRIQSFMLSYTNNFEYQSISLLDSIGKIRLSVPANDSLGHSFPTSFLSNFKHSSKIELISVPRLSQHFSMHLDILVPVHNPQTNDRSILAIIVLHVNPSKMFLPLVNSSLTPNQYVETLLFEYQSNKLFYIKYK